MTSSLQIPLGTESPRMYIPALVLILPLPQSPISGDVIPSSSPPFTSSNIRQMYRPSHHNPSVPQNFSTRVSVRSWKFSTILRSSNSSQQTVSHPPTCRRHWMMRNTLYTPTSSVKMFTTDGRMRTYLILSPIRSLHRRILAVTWRKIPRLHYPLLVYLWSRLIMQVPLNNALGSNGVLTLLCYIGHVIYGQQTSNIVYICTISQCYCDSNYDISFGRLKYFRHNKFQCEILQVFAVWVQHQ